MAPSSPTKDDPPSPVPPGEIEIVIGEDGRIVFTDLPQGLLEVAQELDPNAEIACEIPPQEPSEKATS